MGHLSMNIAKLSGLGFYIMIRDQHGKPEVVWRQDQAQIHTPLQVSTQVSHFYYLHITHFLENETGLKLDLEISENPT